MRIRNRGIIRFLKIMIQTRHLQSLINSKYQRTRTVSGLTRSAVLCHGGMQNNILHLAKSYGPSLYDYRINDVSHHSTMAFNHTVLPGSFDRNHLELGAKKVNHFLKISIELATFVSYNLFRYTSPVQPCPTKSFRNRLCRLVTQHNKHIEGRCQVKDVQAIPLFTISILNRLEVKSNSCIEPRGTIRRSHSRHPTRC